LALFFNSVIVGSRAVEPVPFESAWFPGRPLRLCAVVLLSAPDPGPGDADVSFPSLPSHEFSLDRALSESKYNLPRPRLPPDFARLLLFIDVSGIGVVFSSIEATGFGVPSPSSPSGSR
jgi:hypothetical protein